MKYPELARASEVFRAQGLRMTMQRRLILEALEETEEHLDAERLYQRLRARDQSVSLATVYRTLHLLYQAGLIEQRFLDGDQSRGYYEIRDEEHYHFTCRQCGRVIEFESELVEQISQALTAQHGVQVQRARVHFEGLCADCAARA